MGEHLKISVSFCTLNGKNQSAEKLRNSKLPIQGYLCGLYRIEPLEENVEFNFEESQIDAKSHGEKYSAATRQAYETLRDAIFQASESGDRYLIDGAYEAATRLIKEATKPPGKIVIKIELPSVVQVCKSDLEAVLSTICTIAQIDQNDVELNVVQLVKPE